LDKKYGLFVMGRPTSRRYHERRIIIGGNMNIAIWIIAGLLAAEFVVAGVRKLASPAMRAHGAHFGLSSGFMLFVGLAELAGAAGLLVPLLRPVAAPCLAVLMVGAVVGHLRARDPVARVVPGAATLALLVVVEVLALV
jgi:uncharacterized membrane protein YphA (DoxX/SURF4 family)